MKKNIIGYLLAGLATLILLAGIGLIVMTALKEDGNQLQATSLEGLTSTVESVEIDNTNTIIVGVDVNFPPMTFKTGSGKFTGFEVDMLKEVGKAIDKKIYFKGIAWAEKDRDLESKKIDVVVSGVTMTEERKNAFGFSKSYMNNKIVPVVTTKSGLFNVEDLEGLSAGTQKGTIYGEVLKSELEDNGVSLSSIKEIYPNNASALSAMLSGSIDLMACEETTALYFGSRTPNTFRVVNGNYPQRPIGMLLRKEDSKLTSEINQGIDTIKNNGTYDALYKKWFGTSN